MTLLHPRPVLPLGFLAAGTATTALQAALAQTQNGNNLAGILDLSSFLCLTDCDLVVYI